MRRGLRSSSSMCLLLCSMPLLSVRTTRCSCQAGGFRTRPGDSLGTQVRGQSMDRPFGTRVRSKFDGRFQTRSGGKRGGEGSSKAMPRPRGPQASSQTGPGAMPRAGPRREARLGAAPGIAPGAEAGQDQIQWRLVGPPLLWWLLHGLKEQVGGWTSQQARLGTCPLKRQL